ncbi:MAG TPA: hypothetical protein VFA04_04940 [Bryobacteraceae bacterium]|nr:hypothetical protein [Bryobacteraceae bacterium]
MPREGIPASTLASVAARWRFLAAVIGATAILVFAVSELLPRRYTAVTTVIIDPPAASDARTGSMLNPAYLDSLRTFEHFFTSDALFQDAAQRFHLDTRNQDIDRVRARVLKVKQQHETRILEVSVTLGDPETAWKLAQFITQRSIAESREHAISVDRDSMSNLSAEVDKARAEMERAEADWREATQNDTPESIQAALDSEVSLESDIRTHQNEAAADREEWQVRAREGQVTDRAYAQVQARAAEARRDDYAKQRAQLDAEITADRRRLAEKTARLALASARLDMTRKAFESAQTRLRDFDAIAGMRSERMRMIDPGVIPRRPSFPNVPLNTLAGIILAACLGIGWVVLRADETRPQPAMVRAAKRLA